MAETDKSCQELRTDDLAMATYLSLEGYKHDCLEMKDRRSAEWVFNGDGDLHAAAQSYQEEQALVEPLAFSRRLRRIREELYGFIKANA